MVGDPTVEQLNAANAEFDSSIDQANNVGLSQDITADNTCGATGTSIADCSNIDAFNDIFGITQGNMAHGVQDASSTQFNNAVVDQNMVLLNDCDETEVGNNEADCTNFEPSNIIGPITQTSGNEAGLQALGATIPQSNVVQIAQNLQAVNNCDEKGDGTNLAFCENDSPENFIDDIDGITQENLAPTVADDFVQNNLVAISQDLQATNDCDEFDDGNNGDGVVADCENNVDNEIGPVDQSNFATGSDAADISQNNDITSMNQVLVANNDCDQSSPGDNLAFCVNSAFNDIDSITQENDADGDQFSDILQDNDAAFSQVLDVNNDCNAATTLLLAITKQDVVTGL